MINKDYLKSEAIQFGIDLDEKQLDDFDKYAKMLVEKNKVMNLTAITEPDEIVLKHFVDSLAIFKFCEFPIGATVIDVGCGAGFPSIPMLIARPDLKFTMLDSLNKRLVFIDEVLSALNIKADTVHLRGEEGGRMALYREKFDFAVARAVAPLNVLAEYCVPFIKVNGLFVSLKGSKDETEDAMNAVSILGAQIEDKVSYKLSNGDARNIIMIKKISHTSTKYPRNSGKISKSPL